jgi:murein DD-endopeptidase MepM/ murein hydrolase activator NlpD
MMTTAALCAVAGLGAVMGGAGVVASPASVATTTREQVSFALPVPGPVTRLFDRPLHRWSAGHRGVDLAAAPGTTVRSPAAGIVTFAGPVAGRGVVTVCHPDGLRSSLEPVSTTLAVGDRVLRGTPLGTLEVGAGHDGLHWGVRDGTTYLDPLGMLARPGPIVLLPDDA